jgi:hypothetical protein
MSFYDKDYSRGIGPDDFKFGNANVQLIIGNRHCGKTTACANETVNALARGKSVLAVLPTRQMSAVFKDYCHDAANELGFPKLTYFKLEHYILSEQAWGTPPRGTFDLIVFVDGPDDSRNSVFNGQHHAFNLDPSFHAMLVMHRDHINLTEWDDILECVRNVKPKFIVSCNLFNLYRETAQLFLNWMRCPDITPVRLLERAKELNDDTEIVRGIVVESCNKTFESVLKDRFRKVMIPNAQYRGDRVPKKIQFEITTSRGDRNVSKKD